MHKTTILLIEDDENMREIVSGALKGEDYKVVCAVDGREGMNLAASICPNLILLDLGLPDMDGTEIIMSLRQWTNTPIIIISARSTENDKINSLDLGADDYLIKPFGIGELKARVRTELRHYNGGSLAGGSLYKIKDMVIDCDRRSISIEGREIHFTKVEYDLLTILARNAGKVMTYKNLMERIWGPYVDNNNQILRVNMANIRKKIEENPSNPKYVFTEVGVGYRMAE